MKLIIEPTSKLVEINGVPARVWEGQTESGIAVHCFVTRVAVPNDADQSQFQRELSEQRAPSAQVEAIPFRMII